MKILFVSDLHGRLPKPQSIPQADVLLLGGDVFPYGSTHLEHMLPEAKEWAQDTLSPWLEEVSVHLGNVPIISIAGNRDFLFTYPWGELVSRRLPWIYLRDQSIEIQGLKLYGTPWSCRRPGRPASAFQKDDYALKEQWRRIPEDTDILMVHGPIENVLDETKSDTHAGSKTLREILTRPTLKRAPSLILCGHIHESSGICEEKLSGDESSLVVNASVTQANPNQTLHTWMMIEGSPNSGWKASKVRVPMPRKMVFYNKGDSWEAVRSRSNR